MATNCPLGQRRTFWTNSSAIPSPSAVTSIAALAVMLVASSGLAAEISGIPLIVDGDTVQIGPTKIRFAGVDAPESDQVCLDSKSARWACGVSARDELIKYSAGRSSDCDLVGTDRYGRFLGKCFVEGEDVSAWMVRSGFALSFFRYSQEYDHDEAIAREAKSGAFIAPWDWRHRNEATIVLGALSVPVDAPMAGRSSIAVATSRLRASASTARLKPSNDSAWRCATRKIILNH